MTFSPANWPPDWPEIQAAIADLFASGDWGRYKSPHQEQLKNRLASRTEVETVRLCGSGSAAIEISLRAAKVNPGDGVIVAAFDYPGNFRAIEAVGALPVLVDVQQSGISIDAGKLAEHVADAKAAKVRAMIVSHLFGTAAEIRELRECCDTNKWILIEDACQVPGMMIGGKQAGSFGDLATLSFGGSKPLTAGSGGAVLTNDARLAARISALLDRPSDSQPLSTLQAATLLPQLDRLDECNRIRNATLSFLESNVNGQLTSWNWLSQKQADVSPTHYKVAWQCESAQHRNRIIDAATNCGLPIGAAFRSMAASSQRRCRKLMPLTRCQELGETAFVLDHSALLVGPEQHDSLRSCLVKLHNQTK
ncbi:MAG: DegT/DnrJ/EryC1/StrS aminotransferase family protein [Pirellulaceae bacterium]